MAANLDCLPILSCNAEEEDVGGKEECLPVINTLVNGQGGTARKRKRRKSGISRFVRSGNSKRVTSVLANPIPQERSSSIIPPTVSDTKPSSKSLLKSTRNKLEYQQRKNLLVQQQAETLKDKLEFAHDHISDLEHSNQQSLSQIIHFKTEAEKASKLLASRSERFVEFRERSESEKKRIRAMARSRIEKLERQHKLELLRSQSNLFRFQQNG
jgi:hypothetical protein